MSTSEATAPSTRRIGAPDSATRARLLDAAEALLLEEGYAAVTSRRVAARAGLTHQLVHYYFRTMDDLYVEVFRRRADARLARFEQALASDRSLRTVWAFVREPRGVAFTVEFVALANHRKAIRAEIARYAERFRALQLAAVASILEERQVPAEAIPPIVALVTLTGIGQVVALEEGLGVTTGHDETLAFVTWLLDRLDARAPGESAGAGASRPAPAAQAAQELPKRGSGSGRSL